MLGISGTELLIILFFGFLIFGPEKLPQMGRMVGRAIRQFRQASESMNKKFKEEVADPFQEAVAPYKETVEGVGAPIKEDIDAINKTIQDTKSMFTDPFKDALSFDSKKETAADKVAAAGAAAATASSSATDEATSAPDEVPQDDLGADPFADALDDAPAEPAGQAVSLPKEKPGDESRKIAASLYGLDENEEV